MDNIDGNYTGWDNSYLYLMGEIIEGFEGHPYLWW
jgi:hypothetical protein